MPKLAPQPTTKGWTAPLPATLLVVTTVAMLAVMVLTLFSAAGQERAARGFARGFRLKLEAECPQSLGNPFWFACAAEVRRLHPPARPKDEPPPPSD